MFVIILTRDRAEKVYGERRYLHKKYIKELGWRGTNEGKPHKILFFKTEEDAGKFRKKQLAKEDTKRTEVEKVSEKQIEYYSEKAKQMNGRRTERKFRRMERKRHKALKKIYKRAKKDKQNISLSIWKGI